jgi:hypothetical protein
MMTECKQCGVAYDLGRRYCVELGCGVPLNHAERPSRSKKYEYEKKPIDPLYSRLMSTKLRSKKRGWEHDLTTEFIKELLDSSCVYCGTTAFIQIDRKDNLIGYIQSNVVPACKRCNIVKNMYLSYDEMMTVAKALGWRA